MKQMSWTGVACTLVLASVGRAQVLFVDVDNVNPIDGSSWFTAFDDLQDALAAAAGDPTITEIWIATGTYLPSSNGVQSAAFDLQDGLALYGGFAGTETLLSERDPVANPVILSGDLNGNDLPNFVNYDENSHHVVKANGVTGARLDSVTVRSGKTPGPPGQLVCDGGGGGVQILNSTVTLANVILLENQARPGCFGGGLIANQSNLTLVDCDFVANDSVRGAGAELVGSMATVTGCTFDSNIATGGGGMSLFQNSDVDFVGCTFDSNVATGGGGVVAEFGCVADFDGCSFVDNIATTGGGIAVELTSNVSVRNSQFDNNGTGSSGGGISANDGTITVEDCSFTGGSATLGGGVAATSSNCTVRGSTFMGCDASNGAGIYVSAQGALIEDCTFEGTLACAGTFRLQNGSATLRRCHFDGSSQGNCGVGANSGGIEVSGGSVLVEDSVIFDTELGLLHIASGSATVVNSTLVTETVPSKSVTGNGSIVLANCIVWGLNPSPITGGNVTASSSIVRGGWPGPSNLDIDPLFVDAANGDVRLQPCSPAIDSGDNSSVAVGTVTDLAGNPRFVDDPLQPDTGIGIAPLVDLGAYEFQVSDVVYCTGKLTTNGCLPSIGFTGGPASPAAVPPLEIRASQIVNNRNGLLFYGVNGRTTLPFFGGTLCVQLPLRRTGIQASGGTPPPASDCTGTFSLDFTAWLASGVDPNLTAGTMVNGQYWFRDPPDLFGIGLSDAIEFSVCP